MTTAHDPIDATSQQPTPAPGAADDPGPLLSSHAALVFLAAVVIGAFVGCLTRAAGHGLAESALAGLIGAGASTPVLHRLIGH
ncbi:hypothetical protein ACLB9X_33610 [Streptomyces sp. 5K101]|uniref:hypothetical protein n=1 Tax=Streptomyces sp. 5K101 TaxID=3390037 RepID=UPI003975C9CF